MDNREIDALVAEMVMGWRQRTPNHWLDPRYPDDHQFTVHGDEIPPYSTDIAAAWAVVERMRAIGYAPDMGAWMNMDDGNEWWCCLEHTSSIVGIQSEAPTMPLAICLAALKAVGVDVG